MPLFRIKLQGEGQGFEPFEVKVEVRAVDWAEALDSIPDEDLPNAELDEFDSFKTEIRRLGD